MSKDYGIYSEVKNSACTYNSPNITCCKLKSRKGIYYKFRITA